MPPAGSRAVAAALDFSTLLGRHHNTENETQTKTANTDAKRDCPQRRSELVHNPSVAWEHWRDTGILAILRSW